MENRAHALAAGLFLILLSAVALLVVIWFRGDHIERRPLVVVTQESISGLNPKAPVRLRGVDVGKVDTISFDPANPRQILIVLQVNRDAPLSRGTYAQLGFQGVTGLSFVALADTGADPRPLAEDAAGSAPPRIALQPTLLDQLASAGPQLLTGASEATQRVNAVLSDRNRAELERAMLALNVSLTRINELLGALQPAAGAMPALVTHLDHASQQAAGLLAHATQAVADLHQPVSRLDHAIEGLDQLSGEARGLTQDLRARAVVVDQLGEAARQLTSTTQHLETALGTSTVSADAPLLPELARTTQSLQILARTLEEQPQSLLFGKSPQRPGPGESGFDAPGAHSP